MTSRPPWRVLIANLTLAGRTGTETVTRDLALGLQAAGHQPMVYARELGGLAEDIRAAGIPVVSRLADLPDEPDVIHGHHHVETVAAVLRYPAAAALFVCHDRTAAASAPPRMGRIRRFVAVDFNCLERLTGDCGIPEQLTQVIPNVVDMERFRSRPPLPPRPTRAAIFSNYAAAGTHLEAVQAACAARHLPLDVIGAGVNNLSTAPEQVLGTYDLVFAKARCALEAMAVGAAVVLCDAAGLGAMVTSPELAHMRRWNFGQRLLCSPLDPEGIAHEIDRYDPVDATAVSTAIRQQADLGVAVAHYVALYAAMMIDPPVPLTFDDDLSDYLRQTVTRISELETALAEYRSPRRMDVLGDSAGETIRLRVLASPEAVPAREPLRVRVEIKNGSQVALGTFPPFPLTLAYRWFATDTGAVVVAEGSRTRILAPIEPGQQSEIVMRIPAPPDAGRYRLRVVLVQEGLRWLDELDQPIAADAIVSVIPADTSFNPA